MRVDPESETVLNFLRWYPRVFHACHRRHAGRGKAEGGVSERDVTILMHLDGSRGVSLSTLARHLGVGRPALSEAISKLVKQGLVEKQRSDAGTVSLRLTRSGAGIILRHAVLDAGRVAALLERIPPRRRQAALRGLKLLAEAAAVLTAESPFHWPR